MKTVAKKVIKKKETQEQMMKRVLKDANHTSISNCSMTGVKFDEAATEAVTIIAEGLVENAKALGILAKVMNASNVTIESMIKIDGK